jgi:hypothetical protein
MRGLSGLNWVEAGEDVSLSPATSWLRAGVGLTRPSATLSSAEERGYGERSSRGEMRFAPPGALPSQALPRAAALGAPSEFLPRRYAAARPRFPRAAPRGARPRFPLASAEERGSGGEALASAALDAAPSLPPAPPREALAQGSPSPPQRRGGQGVRPSSPSTRAITSGKRRRTSSFVTRNTRNPNPANTASRSASATACRA